MDLYKSSITISTKSNARAIRSSQSSHIIHLRTSGRQLAVVLAEDHRASVAGAVHHGAPVAEAEEDYWAPIAGAEDHWAPVAGPEDHQWTPIAEAEYHHWALVAGLLMRKW
ncbi:unnamed protein product [Rhodiola kirilowii]